MIASELSETIASFGPLLLGVAGVLGVFHVKRDTKAINDAVNHRKPDEMKLIDLTVDTNEKLNHHLGWHEGTKFVTSDELAVELARQREPQLVTAGELREELARSRQ